MGAAVTRTQGDDAGPRETATSWQPGTSHPLQRGDLGEGMYPLAAYSPRLQHKESILLYAWGFYED